jgi:CheY-like chemotaxis protein
MVCAELGIRAPSLMDTLGQAIDRRPALGADALCEDALAIFVRDGGCRVLAVQGAGGPVGVVSREVFMARMEAHGAAHRPITEAMEVDFLVGEAGEAPASFITRAMAERPNALAHGFVVVDGGGYLGVGDLLSLASALRAPGREASLIERICAEVREPIAHALAAAEGLRRMRLPQGTSAHLDTITDASHSTLALLDVAAELQKAEAGRLPIAPEPRRLQDLMDQLEARWRTQAENAGVTLLVSYAGQPDCAANVDHGRILQIFDALIDHAMAHAGRGVIEASLQATPGETGVALTGRVRDNSATYTASYLDQMFRGGVDAAQVGGMGIQLGLLLAERAVAAMAGRMEVRANTGPGATLSFDFMAEAADAAGEATDASQPQGGRPAHILVVDDNATNRMVVEALCEMFNCSTESVVDGVEAVDAAKAGRFDLILMDIKMPRMDGVTAAREIRKLAAPAGRVPIIALTANADPDEVAEYLAAGMRSVVEKPIKPERLMEALESAFAEDPPHGTAAAA